MTSSEGDAGRLAQRYRTELAEAKAEAAQRAVPVEVPDRRALRAEAKALRAQRARGGWFNWYVDRGRLPLNPTERELRAVSWRRVF